MSKISNMLVAVFISKNKSAGDPGWAFVTDFNSGDDFIKWFTERRKFYGHVAVSWYGDFKSLNEIDEFKAYLKGMFKVGPVPNFTKEQFDKYNDMNFDMYHYHENEFDLMIENYKMYGYKTKDVTITDNEIKIVYEKEDE